MDAMYLKMTSQDGHDFIVKSSKARASNVIEEMMELLSDNAEENSIDLKEVE